MATFNKRVFRETETINDNEGIPQENVFYSIREVGYGQLGNLESYGDIYPPTGSNLEELREEIDKMREAFYKPILTKGAFK